MIDAPKNPENAENESVLDWRSRDYPEINLFALASILLDKVNRTFKEHLEVNHDLTLPEWRVMMTLKISTGLTAADIVGKWGMDKMIVSRAIAKLNERGFVARTPHPSDLRAHRLALTLNGAREFRCIVPVVGERYSEFIDCFSQDEVRDLRKN